MQGLEIGLAHADLPENLRRMLPKTGRGRSGSGSGTAEPHGLTDIAVAFQLDEQTSLVEVWCREHLIEPEDLRSRHSGFQEATLPFLGWLAEEGPVQRRPDGRGLDDSFCEREATEVVETGYVAKTIPEVVLVDDSEAQPGAISARKEPVVGNKGHVRLCRGFAFR